MRYEERKIPTAGNMFYNTIMFSGKIKEWKPANNLELLKEMQSSGTLSTHIWNLVNDMLDDFTRPIDKDVSFDY